MKLKSITAATITLILLLVSCSEPSPRVDIEQLKERVNINPDSVIVVLESIRQEQLTAYDDAATALLLTQAQLEVDDDFRSDSLIAPAYDYLLRHGTLDDRAYATYYRARVEENNARFREASELYLSLIQELETAPENKYLQELQGVTYGALASIYFMQNYHQEALEYYKQARDKFYEIGDEESVYQLRFMYAVSLLGRGDREAGMEELSKLRDECEDSALKLFTSISILSHSVTEDEYPPEELMDMLEQIDYNAVVELSGNYKSDEWSESPIYAYNTNAAFVHYRAGNYKRAYDYINESLEQMSEITPLNVGYFKAAAEIAQSYGQMEEALKFQRIYSTKQDSLNVVMRQQQVRDVEQEFRRRTEDEVRVAGLRYRLYIWAMVALLFIGATVWAVMAYRRRVRRHEEQVAEYISMIESYREGANAFTVQLRESDAREALIKKYLISRRDMVQQIASTYYTYGESERFAEKMRDLALSEGMLRDIVEMTDLHSSGAVTRLRTVMSGWTAKNYNFAALVIAGFSPQEISVMLAMTLGGVYTQKSKLKRRITESSDEAAREFLPYFE